MFPAQGPGAPQQQAAPPQQPSPWQPPQQQGFAPQQQGFQPPQQQGFAPGPPPGIPPNRYAPPGAPQQPPNPYAQPPNPYAPQAQANPYAPPGAPPPANPYAPPGAPPNPYAQQPAPHGHPPQPPYAPHPATPAPMHGGGAKKSSKGLVIGIVAAVAVAGGVVAFIMLRGGGGAGGGGSRTEVVKGVLAALADGSVDDLVKMSDPKGLYAKMVDCDGKTERVKSDMDRDDEDDDELSEKDKDERDPAKVLEKQKKEFGEIVKLTKGAKIELVEIVGKEPPAPTDDEKKKSDDDDDDDGDDGEKKNRGFVFKKGQRLMKGCVAKTTVRIMEVKLKVKVTPPKEQTIEQDAEMMMIQIGKGWWMITPPTINVGAGALMAEVTGMKDKVCACKDAACAKKLKDDFKESPRRKEIKKQIKALPEADRDKIDRIEDEIKACERKLGGGEAVAALTQFKDKMCACTDRACADRVSQEMMVWSKSHMDDEQPDSDQLKEVTAISEQLAKCMMKAMEEPASGGGIGATIGEAGGTVASGDLPPSCVEYKSMMERLTTCSKLPQQSRDAFKQGLETMEKAWKDVGTVTGSARKMMDDSCRQGVDTLKQTASQLGC